MNVISRIEPPVPGGMTNCRGWQMRAAWHAGNSLVLAVSGHARNLRALYRDTGGPVALGRKLFPDDVALRTAFAEGWAVAMREAGISTRTAASLGRLALATLREDDQGG